MGEIAELLVAQIWNGQSFRQQLQTTDGRKLRVVYPGVWTHGFGPDFRDAMLDLDGHLITGDVEVELEAAGWFHHGHNQNNTFDNVVLQVVVEDNVQGDVRRSDGGVVPRVVLPEFLDRPLDAFVGEHSVRPLGAIGFEHCAPAVAAEHPEVLRNLWQRAGDRRMQEKVAAVSGNLAVENPAQVLYSRFLDALGYSRNREPMREVAARMTIDQLMTRLGPLPVDRRFWRAAGLLLGAGGFLPLSPRDSAIATLTPAQVGLIEKEWMQAGDPWRGIEVSPGFWTLARLRPAAHPVRRLLAAAALISAASEGIVERLVQCLLDPHPRRMIMEWLTDQNPYLGKDHAHELVVNVVIPFALGYGEQADQVDITDAAAQLWQELPAGRGNSVIRATREQICGDAVVAPGSARAEQGLIHINRNGCSKMRCFECPVAHLAVQKSSRSSPETERL